MSLVYSTDFGRACPGCGQPVAQCAWEALGYPAFAAMLAVFFLMVNKPGL